MVVLGSAGQLGSSIVCASECYSGLEIVFLDRNQMDILDKEDLKQLAKLEFDILINCAAFTAVDTAEKDSENCFAINVQGTINTMQVAREKEAFYIGFSTDYVFDGESSIPYRESDPANPLNVYGQSKLDCEKALLKYPKALIFRVSWLYSAHHKNFLTTMAALGSNKKELSIVSDQVGSPTEADKFAMDLLSICDNGLKNYNMGLFHYTHEGVTNWCDFAKEIFAQLQLTLKVNTTTTEAYGAPAKRPSFSKLDCTKAQNEFKLTPIHWKDALASAIHKLKK